ncbi:MAG: DUF3006 domain-containing protein [Oscillospiraceae bacterium]|nr:DUF3006 domain-containing protein [Oscillospiraceae bacterium]
MGKLYTIDRFEGEFAVLEEDGDGHIDVPKGQLPEGTHEGDVLEQSETGFIIREDLTRERRERIIGKQKRLFKHRSEET